MHKKCKSLHHTKPVNVKSGESNLLFVPQKQNTRAPGGAQISDIKEKKITKSEEKCGLKNTKIDQLMHFKS